MNLTRSLKAWVAVAGAAALITLPAPAAAQSESTLRLTDSSATTLRDGTYANRNLSTAKILETRVGSASYNRRIQLKFDTHNTIPLGTTVRSATLTLTVAGGNRQSRTLGLYRGAYSYNEWQTTWNRRKYALSWPAPGGDMRELAGRQTVTSVKGSKVTFDVTAVMQKIVNGTYSRSSRYARFLVADVGAASRQGYKQYYSDEAADPALRPVLTVSFARPASGGTGSGVPARPPAPAPAPAPAPVPEPEPDPEPEPSGAVKLRVMEWNIGHGRGTDGVYNIGRQAAWMATINPDVIILNEVEKYTSWGNEDQPSRFKSMLQARTGRTWYMHFAQEYGQWSSRGKGHLILSKYPIEASGHTRTTPSAGLNGAGAISQATIIVNGRTINFVVAHLDPYSHSMRMRQVREVLAWGSGFAENRLLVGDMNAWPDQSSIAEINKTYVDSWTVAAGKGRATGIRGVAPFGATKKGRIDYIFVSRNAPNLVVVDSRTPDTRDRRGYMPSDHRPLVTTFEVR